MTIKTTQEVEAKSEDIRDWLMKDGATCDNKVQVAYMEGFRDALEWAIDNGRDPMEEL